ncbi:MAG: HD domain-containing protein [Deltaproteobacteria bacterium]|nr:HD domain-containing protein [Deltaproteobacteria bacterium]
MNNMNLAVVNHEGPISGRYRLRNPLLGQTQQGRPFFKMYLEDMTGIIPAFTWQIEEEIPDDLSLVQVGGLVKKGRGNMVVDIGYVAPVRRVDSDVVRLIPRSICPRPELLAALAEVVKQIQVPALRAFVVSVLSDDAIAFPFVGCPASLPYHHNYPGGLLYHSIECAQMLGRYQEFPREKKELGMVAGLFHDIGKIRTMTSKMKRTHLGKCVDHDALTLEVLAPYLRHLDIACPKEAAELRYILTWKAGSKNRGIPKTPLVNAVLGADRVSAGVNGG